MKVYAKCLFKFFVNFYKFLSILSSLFQKRFPFDTNNPVGYLIAVFLQYIMLGYQNFTIAATVGLSIGGYWFAVSVTNELQRMLRAINDKTRAKKENQLSEMKTLLSEFVDTHVAIKQLSIF